MPFTITALPPGIPRFRLVLQCFFIHFIHLVCREYGGGGLCIPSHPFYQPGQLRAFKVDRIMRYQLIQFPVGILPNRLLVVNGNALDMDRTPVVPWDC